MAGNDARPSARLRPRFWFRGIRVGDFVVATGPLLLVGVLALGVAYWFVQPAPSNTLSIASGPAGSIFRLTAEKYREILARNGITLRIVPSKGSLDNLEKLLDPASHVDIGFVQGGVVGGLKVQKLMSLGAVFHEPLALFYRGRMPRNGIAGLRGKRLAIGPEGSGGRALALTLLKANEIEPGGSTALLPLGGEAAAQALTAGRIDAAFLMGDSAKPPTMRRLFRTPGIHLLNFRQANAYVRRFPYLSKLDLPRGVIDLGRNLPRRDLRLIGPTVQLVAREDLHPALSDLLIEAAREVHGGPSLLQHAGEFPAPLPSEFHLSSDAKRYYTSGKTFLYRTLPFWMASLADRLLVVVVPIVVLLIPAFKLVPTIYQWRIRSRIYRWYGALLGLERDILAQPEPGDWADTLTRLDDIETAVNRLKVPLAFADQLYVLRDHIAFVRDRYAGDGRRRAWASGFGHPAARPRDSEGLAPVA